MLDILTKREIIFLIFCVLVGIIASTVNYETRVALEFPILCLSFPLILWVVSDPKRIG